MVNFICLFILSLFSFSLEGLYKKNFSIGDKRCTPLYIHWEEIYKINITCNINYILMMYYLCVQLSFFDLKKCYPQYFSSHIILFPNNVDVIIEIKKLGELHILVRLLLLLLSYMISIICTILYQNPFEC